MICHHCWTRAAALIGSRVASASGATRPIDRPPRCIHVYVMLSCSHGASTLGRQLRRPIIQTMSSFEGSSTLAFDAMRSTLAALRGGRALSATPRINAPSFPRNRIWTSDQPILFNEQRTSSPRAVSTLTISEVEQHVILDSLAEDEYVATDSPEPSERAVESEGAGQNATGATDGTEVASQTDFASKHDASIGHNFSRVKTDDTGADSKRNEVVPVDEAAVELAEDPSQNELPVTTLPFQMLEDKFRAAKNAEPGTPESFWSYTMYRGPDGAEHKIKVHYCKSKHTTERCLDYFEGQKVIGFDIEWKPQSTKAHGIKKNVSLIQLASEDRIALFHIALYPKDEISDLVGPKLKQIMEDPEITKVGVAIKADCTRLQRYLDIKAKGIFELSHLYKLIKYSDSKEFKLINKRLVSLATQVQEHLHLPMFKGEVRSSDWSQPLQLDQITYAASDTYAGVQLYSTMNHKRLAIDPTPPLPYHAELDRPIRLADGITIPIDPELEGIEPDESLSSSSRAPRISSKYFASTAETLELDPEFEISAPTPPVSKTRLSKPAPDPLVQEATTLAAEYRATHSTNRAAASSLRAYYIWQNNQSMSVENIAALLKNPPLQTNTVVNYILEAVRLEKLPFEKERLRDVLGRLPKDIVQGRYRTLLKAVEDKLGTENLEIPQTERSKIKSKK